MTSKTSAELYTWNADLSRTLVFQPDGRSLDARLEALYIGAEEVTVVSDGLALFVPCPAQNMHLSEDRPIDPWTNEPVAVLNPNDILQATIANNLPRTLSDGGWHHTSASVFNELYGEAAFESWTVTPQSYAAIAAQGVQRVLWTPRPVVSSPRLLFKFTADAGTPLWKPQPSAGTPVEDTRLLAESVAKPSPTLNAASSDVLQFCEDCPFAKGILQANPQARGLRCPDGSYDFSFEDSARPGRKTLPMHVQSPTRGGTSRAAVAMQELLEIAHQRIRTCQGKVTGRLHGYQQGVCGAIYHKPHPLRPLKFRARMRE